MYVHHGRASKTPISKTPIFSLPTKSFLGSDWEVGTTSDVDEYPLK